MGIRKLGLGAILGVAFAVSAQGAAKFETFTDVYENPFAKAFPGILKTTYDIDFLKVDGWTVCRVWDNYLKVKAYRLAIVFASGWGSKVSAHYLSWKSCWDTKSRHVRATVRWKGKDYRRLKGLTQGERLDALIPEIYRSLGRAQKSLDGDLSKEDREVLERDKVVLSGLLDLADPFLAIALNPGRKSRAEIAAELPLPSIES